MGHGPFLILTPKIVKEQWVKSDLLNGKTARRFQNNNNNNNLFFSFCRSWNRVGQSFLTGVARVLQWLAGMLL